MAMFANGFARHLNREIIKMQLSKIRRSITAIYGELSKSVYELIVNYKQNKKNDLTTNIGHTKYW